MEFKDHHAKESTLLLDETMLLAKFLVSHRPQFIIHTFLYVFVATYTVAFRQFFFL